MAHKLIAKTNDGPYRPAWDHLNDHEDLGFTARAVVGLARGDDERVERWVYLRTSRPVTRREMFKGILWQFDRECQCEHDCCGHWQAIAHMRRMKSNRRGTRWAVPVVSYRNI